MSEEYRKMGDEEASTEEKIIDIFVSRLNSETFEAVVETFLDDPGQVLYNDNGDVDMATTLKADYFMRFTMGEFVEAEQYLSEACVHIEDEDLRNQLITEFDLDREYIESELDF